METPNVKIYIYKFLGDGQGHASTPMDISKFVSADENDSIEVSKDTFNISLKGTYKNNNYNTLLTNKIPVLNTFNFQDNIKVYAWYGSTPTNLDSYLIFDALVKSVQFNKKEKDLTLSLKTVNRTDEILRFYLPYVSSAKTGSIIQSPYIIRELLTNKINLTNKKSYLKVYGYLNNEYNDLTGSLGTVQALKSDNTAFPKIDYSKTYIPVYQHVAELSQDIYTGDTAAGTYIYYIKSTPVLPIYQPEHGKFINELVWKSKSLTSVQTLTEDIDIFNCNINYSIGDIYNFYICDCCVDCNGAGIHAYAINTESAGRYGKKTKYYSKSRRMASEIINYELKHGNLKNSYHTATDIDPTNGRLPAGISAGSTWVFSFSTRDNAGVQTGAFATAVGTKEYNSAIRTEAKWRGQKEAESILLKTGLPKYTVSCDLKIGNTRIAGNQFQIGDFYKLKIPSIGWGRNITSSLSYPDINLRLVNVIHRFDSKKWETNLKFVEDENYLSKKVNQK